MASLNVTVNKIKLSPSAATSTNNRLQVEFGYVPTIGATPPQYDKVTVDQPLLFTSVEWDLAIRSALGSFAQSKGHTVSRILYLDFINNVVNLI